MPRLYDIENITGSANLENIGGHYNAVRAALSMRWSDEQKLYVRDIQH